MRKEALTPIPSPRGRGAKVMFVLFFIVVVVLLWPANPFDLSITNIEIPKGASVRTVQSVLREKGILPHYSSFRLTVRIFGLQNKIKAGEYAFSPSDSLPKVIFKLAIGKIIPPQQIRVTFPEGTSIYKMGLILKDAGFREWKRFQELTKEGYLFPDTYRFFADASVEAVAETMVARFEEVVLPFWDKAKINAKFSLHEILTLASIIEKEAQLPAELPIISSVYHNRLRIGMALAADPTIKYALERPTKIVSLDQLSVKSPYNTYKRRGLPPGPICNPGLDSIKAAIYPAKTDYLYFVAKPDGSHVFSKTWEEHQKARQKFTPTR